MLLGKPFEQFVEESPISVMMRGIVEYAFEAKRLDDLFEDTAETQYTRTLRFSTIADLMSEVVFDISSWDGRGGGKCIGILSFSGDLQDLCRKNPPCVNGSHSRKKKDRYLIPSLGCPILVMG